MRHILIALSFIVITPSAFAWQKCTAPDGRVEYTDRTCEYGSTASRPHLTDNTIDSRDDRAHAQRNRYEDAAPAASARAYSGGGGDRSNSYSCRLATKNYQTGQSSITKGRSRNPAPQPDASVAAACGSGFAAAHATPPAAPPPPPARSAPAPAPIFSSCDTGGCWDTMGGRYTSGAGGTYFGPGGRVCHRIGPNILCD